MMHPLHPGPDPACGVVRSISTVYRAVCSITQAPVIIKAYDKSKMKPKNFSRMEREIRLMRILGGGDGLVDLYAVFQDANFKYLVRIMRRATDSGTTPLHAARQLTSYDIVVPV